MIYLVSDERGVTNGFDRTGRKRMRQKSLDVSDSLT